MLEFSRAQNRPHVLRLLGGRVKQSDPLPLGVSFWVWLQGSGLWVSTRRGRLLGGEERRDGGEAVRGGREVIEGGD